MTWHFSLSLGFRWLSQALADQTNDAITLKLWFVIWKLCFHSINWTMCPGKGRISQNNWMSRSYFFLYSNGWLTKYIIPFCLCCLLSFWNNSKAEKQFQSPNKTLEFGSIPLKTCIKLFFYQKHTCFCSISCMLFFFKSQLKQY